MDDATTLWPLLTQAQQRAFLEMMRACVYAEPRQPLEWMSIKQAAKEFGISQRTIYSAIKDRRLTCKVPNGQVRGMRVSRQEMERWTGMRTC